MTATVVVAVDETAAVADAIAVPVNAVVVAAAVVNAIAFADLI